MNCVLILVARALFYIVKMNFRCTHHFAKAFEPWTSHMRGVMMWEFKANGIMHDVLVLFFFFFLATFQNFYHVTQLLIMRYDFMTSTN